ncbi:MAG TPA: T9SS type A sorting domain-containing protein [Bacteroidales bacterium]|nr:T9SS type A sorting domain-containing protein [Bacteroidales bacterium]HRX96387.1 T9SS type A sorting domain-containing protein [Bacteroidales bacterium]
MILILKNLVLFSIFIFGSSLLNSQDVWVKSDGPYGGIGYSYSKLNNQLIVGTFNGLYTHNENSEYWDFFALRKFQVIAFCQYADDTLFAGVSFHTDYAQTTRGLYASYDGGDTWSYLFYNDQINSIFRLNNSIFVYTGNNCLIRSNNTGISWDTLKPFEGVSYYSIADYNQEIYIGTSSGIFKSVDYGENWEDITADLPISAKSLRIVQESLFANDDYDLYKQTVNNDWIHINTPFSNNQDIIIESDNNSIIAGFDSPHFYKSDDLGLTWNSITGNLPNAELSSGTISGDQLVANLNGNFYVSENAGSNWLMANSSIEGEYINCLDASGNVLFMATSTEPFISHDQGLTWDKIEYFNDKSDQITHCDVFGTNIYIITFSKLYLSADAGNEWVESTIPTTNPHLTSVAGNDSLLYVVEDYFNVYLSEDKGITWENVSISLPENRLIDYISLCGNKLYVGLLMWDPYPTNYFIYRKNPQFSDWDFIKQFSNTELLTDITNLGDTAIISTKQNIYKDFNGVYNMEPIFNQGVVDVASSGYRIMAATSSDFYQSNNGGISWNLKTANYNDTIIPQCKLNGDPSKFYFSTLTNIWHMDVGTNTRDNYFSDINNKLTIYPSVANDRLSCSYNGKGKITVVEVYNLAGEKMKEIIPGSNLLTLNVSDLARGTYIIRVIISNNNSIVIHRKFIKN